MNLATIIFAIVVICGSAGINVFLGILALLILAIIAIACI